MCISFLPETNSKVNDEFVPPPVKPRRFDHHTTWEDVQDMTVDEAVMVLSRLANSDGREWSARPHLAKACQMAIEALNRMKG